MHHPSSGHTVERRARHLASIDDDIVPSGERSVDPQLAKHVRHLPHCPPKHLLNVGLRGDKGEHHVALIGVHGAAATLPSGDKHVVGIAVIHVHLIGEQLVSSDDDRRASLPNEAIVVVGEVACGKFLYRKVEGNGRCRAHFRGSNDVFHPDIDCFLVDVSHDMGTLPLPLAAAWGGQSGSAVGFSLCCRLPSHRPLCCLPASFYGFMRSAALTPASTLSIGADGSKRSTTCPSRSMRTLVKFHFTSEPWS